MGVAIAELGYEDVVANEERRLLRPARYVEGLIEKRPDEERAQPQQREQDNAKYKIHNHAPRPHSLTRNRCHGPPLDRTQRSMNSPPIAWIGEYRATTSGMR